MTTFASQLQHCLTAERDAHRRQVELVRASLAVRPEGSAAQDREAGRRA